MGDAWFRQEYLCEFLDAGGEGFIYADWLERCSDLDVKTSEVDQVFIGLDVARSVKGDKTVFAMVRGNAVVEIETSRQPNLMATVGRAVQLIDQYEARAIRIDDTGVGGGVTDRLSELAEGPSVSRALFRCEVLGFNFASKPFCEERFADIRTEMWWSLGEKLRREELKIPRDPALFEQLSAPMMLQDSRSRLRMESKDSMRKRGIKSPDLADALALAAYPDDWFIRSGVWLT